MLSKKVKSRIFFLIVASVVTSAIIFFILKSLEDNVVYFFSPSDIYNKTNKVYLLFINTNFNNDN